MERNYPWSACKIASAHAHSHCDDFLTSTKIVSLLLSKANASLLSRIDHIKRLAGQPCEGKDGNALAILPHGITMRFLVLSGGKRLNRTMICAENDE